MKAVNSNLYKIYFENKKENFKLYVKAVVLGGNPLIKIIPAFDKEEAGIFEKDKAKKYIELINNDRAKLEEVKVYVD